MIATESIDNGILDMRSVKYVSPQTRDRLKAHIVEKDDIVFGRAGSVDRHLYIDDKYVGFLQGSNCIRMRKRESINMRYLSYYLQLESVKKQITNHSSGSVQSFLNTDKLGAIEIVLQDDSNKIANLLYSFDKKIALNNRLNATLEAMAKTLYDYWFVQFDFPDEKGRPYKTSGGKMVYNEELGREIPAGWEVKLIGDLLEKVSVPKGLQTSEYQSEGILPIIDQSQQFIVGYTNCTAMECLPNEAEVIVFGDHTCFFKYINFPFALGADGTQCIISNEPLRMPQLLFYYAIKDISLANKGYARHFKFLKGTSILVPAAKTAQSFQHTTEKLYGVIRKNVRETYRLAVLRDWLLPMLMNGQVGFNGKGA